MKTQNKHFCLSSYRVPMTFFFFFFIFILVIFGVLSLSPIVIPGVNAEGIVASDSIAITAPDIDLDINPANRLTVGKNTVSISASPASGYELYISTTEQNMYLDGDNTDTRKISPTTGTYESPAAIYSESSPAWGYAVAGLDNFSPNYSTTNPSSSSKFAAVPTTEQLITVSKTTTSLLLAIILPPLYIPPSALPNHPPQKLSSATTVTLVSSTITSPTQQAIRTPTTSEILQFIESTLCQLIRAPETTPRGSPKKGSLPFILTLISTTSNQLVQPIGSTV